MSNRTSEAFKAWWVEQPSCDYDEMVVAEKAWEAARAIHDDSVVGKQKAELIAELLEAFEYKEVAGTITQPDFLAILIDVLPDAPPVPDDSVVPYKCDLLMPALRQYQHNDCSGFVTGYDQRETQKIVMELLAMIAAQTGESDE